MAWWESWQNWQIPIRLEVLYSALWILAALFIRGLVVHWHFQRHPDLEIEGVVFTMYDARTNLSLQVVENVKENLKQNIYKSIIPRNVRLAEAPSHGVPINIYDGKSTGAESYRNLAKEIIDRKDI